jgi:hypothetical protein
MQITKEEYKKLSESLKVLQEMFRDQVSRTEAELDNEFVRMLGEKYISPTGMLDLLVDYEMLKGYGPGCGCAGPCHNSCVSPCASRCNSDTYSICHGQDMGIGAAKVSR